jgi:hypothetical protein
MKLKRNFEQTALFGPRPRIFLNFHICRWKANCPTEIRECTLWGGCIAFSILNLDARCRWAAVHMSWTHCLQEWRQHYPFQRGLGETLTLLTRVEEQRNFLSRRVSNTNSSASQRVTWYLCLLRHPGSLRTYVLFHHMSQIFPSVILVHDVIIVSFTNKCGSYFRLQAFRYDQKPKTKHFLHS